LLFLRTKENEISGGFKFKDGKNDPNLAQLTMPDVNILQQFLAIISDD
jgi:hypothetical protein